MEPTYTANVVSAATGVKPVTLRAWRNRGLLDVGAGEGWTYYRFTDLVKIALLEELGRCGVNIGDAVPIIAAADQDLTAIAEGRMPANRQSYILVHQFDTASPVVHTRLTREQLDRRLVAALERQAGVALVLSVPSIGVRVMRFLSVHGAPLPTLRHGW